MIAKRLYLYALLIPGLFLLLPSCKKDSGSAGVDVNFSISVDAYTVTFTNLTTGGTSYKWDFGDGQTSTDQNPVHTYAGKGKYVPTLYVTTAGGTTSEGSTVIRISKSSSVKLDDNSFSDWDTIAYNAYTPVLSTGYFRKAKLDFDGENVYFYFEIASKIANGDIFDFYMDTDNDATTGLTTSVALGAGNDVLLEGQALTASFDMFYHTGAQTSFTFDQQSISGYYALGTVQESNGIVKFEGKLVRSKIQGLTGTGMKLAAVGTKSDWSVTLGQIPDAGVNSMFLNMADE